MTTLSVIEPAQELATKVKAFVTTRVGGGSKGKYASLNLAQHVNDDPAAVTRNREILSESMAAKLSFQWLEQSHSNIVHLIDEAGATLPGDALVTRVPGIACCVLTADCLPIVLANKSGTEVAIIHAGWRGLLNGIIANTINAMDSRAGQIVAWFGPAIGPCHYEVGSDLRLRFEERLEQEPNAEAAYSGVANSFSNADKPGKYMLDLYALAASQLAAFEIDCSEEKQYCTFCEEEKFYSFRRSNETGRMASVVYIEP